MADLHMRIPADVANFISRPSQKFFAENSGMLKKLYITLQDLAGRTNFLPTIPFPSLLMKLLILGKLCNFNQIYS